MLFKKKISELISSTSTSNLVTYKDCLIINDTTDLYLSFNKTDVTIVGEYNEKDGKWHINVNVHDTYNFDYEKIEDIDSVKTAVGGIAASVANMEETPVFGTIKNYSIDVNFNIEV